MAPPRLWLAPATLGRVRELAEAAWPLEACGLLEGPPAAGPVRATRAPFCVNGHDDPRRRYEIDPEVFLRAEHDARARGRTIVGVWHSHPHGDAAASDTDRAEAWPGWSYLIAGVTNGAMTDLRAWWLEADTLAAQAIVAPGRPRPR